MRKLLVTLLAAGLCLTGVHAQETENTDGTVTNTDTNEIKTVTADTYQPIGEMEGAENAAMGDGTPQQPQTQYRSRSANARLIAPVWGMNGTTKTFTYTKDGQSVVVENPKQVVDVSEHDGKINWEKLKSEGIDGAILRIGWGVGYTDEYFDYNISECKRLGIPYGLYLYSYAYDANFAYAEADSTIERLQGYDLTDMSYPIYYDIEAFKAYNHDGATRVPPKDVKTYESIIKTYVDKMNSAGYSGKVHDYSYRSYCQKQLNSAYILGLTSWIAEYGSYLAFDNPYYTGDRGWQYTSEADFEGITPENVDVSMFTNTLLSLQTQSPANLTATVEGTNIKLTWDKVPYNTRYRVYYQTTDDGEWNYLTSQTGTSYTFKTGTSGASYRFVVRTANLINGEYKFSQASFSNRLTYPQKKAQGFYNLSRRVRVFSSPNAANYNRYDPFKKKWMGSMKNYNNKPLLLTREYVNEEGTSYWSAYYNGKWIGYINSYALKNSVKKDTYFGWGENNARVFNTPNPQKYWLYNAPADKWVKRMTGYRNQKFTIKRSLARADGSLYYSCYIGDKWIGYINSWGFQNQ